MPILNSQVRVQGPISGLNIPPGQLVSMALQRGGPVFPIELHVPDALVQSLTANQQPIPAPIVGMAMVDTGATVSCVDEMSMVGLGVFPIGAQPVVGVGGVRNHPVYPARLTLPHAPPIQFAFGALVGVDLQGQAPTGMRLVALLGRDILSQCLLVYNGRTGLVTLAI